MALNHCTDGAQAGVLTLQELLVTAIKNPSKFNSNHNFIKSLSSQGSLAALELNFENDTGQCLCTTPMSLNTLKSHADKMLTGGFQWLNTLRKNALSAIASTEAKKSQPNKRTKTGLSLKVSQLERELEIQRQTNCILLQAMNESLGQFATIRDAPNDKVREKRTHEAQQTLRMIVSLCAPPFNTLDQSNHSSHGVSPITAIHKFRISQNDGE